MGCKACDLCHGAGVMIESHEDGIRVEHQCPDCEGREDDDCTCGARWRGECCCVPRPEPVCECFPWNGADVSDHDGSGPCRPCVEDEAMDRMLASMEAYPSDRRRCTCGSETDDPPVCFCV